MPYQKVEIYQPPMQAIYFYAHKVFCCAKVIDKSTSATVIFRFGRFTMTSCNRYKSHMSSVKYIGHPCI